ncbi:MAG: hypothetical protein IKJ19_02830 [Clostridia bacterium]|nr:hypothetical protein [Clostridia bacterium]
METKQLKVHPDKAARAVSVLPKFGWRIISNQRCQEQERKDDTIYTYTFNILTIEREEDYCDSYVKLYHETCLQIDKHKEALKKQHKPSEPSIKGALMLLLIPGAIAALFTFLEINDPENGLGFIIAGIAGLIGIVAFLMQLPTKKNKMQYKIDLQRYNENQEKIPKLIEMTEKENKDSYKKIIEGCEVNYGAKVQFDDVTFYALLMGY